MQYLPKWRLLWIPPVVLVLVLALVWLALDRFMTEFVLRHTEQAVAEHAQVAAALVHRITATGAHESFDALADQLGAASGLRTSFIDENGVVVGDSRLSLPELQLVENHAARPEVIAAREFGLGTARRFSTTLGADLLYVAVPYQPGEHHGVARVAKPLLAIERGIAETRLLMTALALGVMIVAVLLVHLSTRGLLATIERDRQAFEDRVMQRTARVARLQETGSLLTACEDQTEAAHIIRAAVEGLVPGASGALALFKASRNQVHEELAWGEGHHGESLFPPADCWALRRGMEHTTTRENESTRCAHVGDPGESAVLCLPLQAHGETLGVLQVVTPRIQRPGHEPLQLLKTLAEHAAVALGNIQVHDVLREQAIRDPLTKLFNRRYLSDALDREVMRARRHRIPLSVLMIDIDYFKRFNDDFGHDAGDAVLSAVGQLIADSTRGEDIACRYGGEEFVLVLTPSDAERAREVGERLCDMVRNMPLNYRGQSLSRIGISIGIAVFGTDGESTRDLLNSADRMLYRAKESGRDRVAHSQASSGGEPTPGA